MRGDTAAFWSKQGKKTIYCIECGAPRVVNKQLQAKYCLKHAPRVPGTFIPNKLNNDLDVYGKHRTKKG